MKAAYLLLFLFAGWHLHGQSFEDKVEGMLIGSAIGDAAGAPYEFFYPAQRSYWTSSEEALSPVAIRILGQRFSLSSHFRKASSYGHWLDYAPSGTVTDDTRLKIIFINTLRYHPTLDANAFATEILSFPDRIPQKTSSICKNWLEEFSKAAKWQLGMKPAQGALPAGRLWGGIPSIAGQMALLPLAAIQPENLEGTYKMAWELDFLDNGLARDINAAIVTGLAAALQPGADWRSVELAMRNTDPYAYGSATYGSRVLVKWLDFAHDVVRKSEGSTTRLFDMLERGLEAKTWWESWVPLTVVFACAEMVNYDPLAAMQLCIEFGHDTDSYAQLMGAFMGALHGKEVFPASMQKVLNERLKTDYQENIRDWLPLLNQSKL